jgi:hypothetical protein
MPLIFDLFSLLFSCLASLVWAAQSGGGVRNLAGNFVAVHKGNHRHQLQQYTQSTMLISLTVGKVDAGVAVLLTKDKRLVWTSELHAVLRSRSPLYDSLADDSSICTD